jgi:hypothetical protein
MSFWKSFADGYHDLFGLAPIGLSPRVDTPSMDPDTPPGYAQDAANLAGDWRRVGDYLRKAMDAGRAKANRPAV